jgi:hypothetical protein
VTPNSSCLLDCHRTAVNSEAVPSRAPVDAAKAKPRSASKSPSAHALAWAALSPCRSTTGRRDPRRRYIGPCKHHSPAATPAKPPNRAVRPTGVWPSNWPPPPCPLHGAPQPLPTPAEHTPAYEGGPVRPPPPALPHAMPHVEHLCTPTAASRFSMRYRSAISSAPRFTALKKSTYRTRAACWWRRLIHSEGARTAAFSAPIGPRAWL